MGGSGWFQLPRRGSAVALTVREPVSKRLLEPWSSLEVVSKPLEPVPKGPDWKVLPSATLNRTGLLQRPEQGVACCGWQYERHGSISLRQVVSFPAWPSVRHRTAAWFGFPWQNCASCPHAVIGSVCHNVGLAAGVCPGGAWDTERGAQSSPPGSTRWLCA